MGVQLVERINKGETVGTVSPDKSTTFVVLKLSQVRRQVSRGIVRVFLPHLSDDLVE